jgi:DNA-binding MarR family transcriptional regulator
LVTRAASEIDRRVQIVRLTVEGRRKFRRMAKKNGELVAGIFAGLSPAQVEALTALLTDTKSAVVTATQKPEGAARRRLSGT